MSRKYLMDCESHRCGICGRPINPSEFYVTDHGLLYHAALRRRLLSLNSRAINNHGPKDSEKTSIPS